MYLEVSSRKKGGKINKITMGTKEWATHSINCVNGCSNDCRYCYAKKMAIRFGRKTEDDWKIMEIRQKDVDKRFRKRNGRFMFPTSHDITPYPGVINACMKILEHVLKPGNEVLVTTKPRYGIIKNICQELSEYRSQIQFRFTITSNVNELLEFWEPNAPSYEERLKALKFAFKNGYKTSISIEPFLNEPSDFIDDLIPYVTESIWIGPMNYMKKNGLKSHEMPYFEQIRQLIQPRQLFKIYNELKNCKLIRFKDSLVIKLINAGFLSIII